MNKQGKVKAPENKYEAMNRVLHEMAKMGYPIKMTLNKWGEWRVFILGQKFYSKDVCQAVGEAVKLIIKIKEIPNE